MKDRKKYEIIRKISEIIEKFLPHRNIVITIVNVLLPQKGGYLRVYLSIFPEEEKKQIIQFLNKISSKIKKELKNSLFLRYLPSKIIFYPSEEIAEAQKVLELINEISQKEEKRPED